MALRGEDAVRAAREAVEKLMRKPANKRPYTAVQLWENTKKVVSKAMVQQALDDLVHDERLATKSVGKLVLYYPAQGESSTSTDEICRMLFEELPNLEAQYARTLREAQKREKKAQLLASEPTNAELATARNAVTDDLDAKVAVLSSRVFVDPTTLKKAKTEHDRQLRRFNVLRGVAREVIQLCEERLGDEADFVDVAHLAGVYDDAEANVDSAALPVPAPLLL